MADHWRAPHARVRHSLAIAAGAMVGPLVAILFAVFVMWLAGIVA